jgi:hypothetical protein
LLHVLLTRPLWWSNAVSLKHHVICSTSPFPSAGAVHDGMMHQTCPETDCQHRSKAILFSIQEAVSANQDRQPQASWFEALQTAACCFLSVPSAKHLLASNRHHLQYSCMCLQTCCHPQLCQSLCMCVYDVCMYLCVCVCVCVQPHMFAITVLGNLTKPNQLANLKLPDELLKEMSDDLAMLLCSPASSHPTPACFLPHSNGRYARIQRNPASHPSRQNSCVDAQWCTIDLYAVASPDAGW